MSERETPPSIVPDPAARPAAARAAQEQDETRLCRQCAEQIGLPAEWHAHSKLEAPGSARTLGYTAALHQRLYACRTCHSVLRKGRNTGWALALRAAPAAKSSAGIGPA